MPLPRGPTVAAMSSGARAALGAVSDCDEYARWDVYAAMDAGLSAEDVLLEVIARSSRRSGGVGGQRLTVAQEHAATPSTIA